MTVLPHVPSVHNSERGSTRHLSSARSPPPLSCQPFPSVLRSHPSAHHSPLSTGALCGPLWERCCCRGEKRPGDLQQMAPDRGDGGRSASAGIPAEPQVSRRRAPRSQDGCAFTATSTTLRSRAPSPARGGSPSIPAEHPAPRSFLPRAASSFYCSPSYLLFRCVLKALRPMQHFSHQLPALGRSRQLGRAQARRCPSPAGFSK